MTILPPVVIVDVIIGTVATVKVLELGLTEDSGLIEPVTIVRVTMVTPDIVVPEFGSVVTGARVEVAALGLAVIVMTLVLPCGTVTTLLPPKVVVRPLGPPESVVVNTELAGGALAGIVTSLEPAGLEAGALAGMVTTLVPPAGIVTMLWPKARVVVAPEGPPVSVVMTTLELGGFR